MSEKQIITKRITLHKRQISEERGCPIESQYRCFGNFDGLSVENLQPETANLENLWVDSIDQSQKLSQETNIQNFYVARIEREGENRDEIFWGTEKPFLLTSFISLHSDNGINYTNVIFEIEKNENTICYLTMELSSIVIFIKRDKYRECDEIITELRHSVFNNNEIVYSYSIPSIPMSNLVKDNQVIESIYNENAEKVILSLMSKCGTDKKNSTEFVNKLKEKLNKYTITYSSVLGSGDVQVEILNINLGHLLLLHKTESLLCHTNSVYAKYIYNCTTRIHIRVD